MNIFFALLLFVVPTLCAWEFVPAPFNVVATGIVGLAFGLAALAVAGSGAGKYDDCARDRRRR